MLFPLVRLNTFLSSFTGKFFYTNFKSLPNLASKLYLHIIIVFKLVKESNFSLIFLFFTPPESSYARVEVFLNTKMQKKKLQMIKVISKRVFILIYFPVKLNDYQTYRVFLVMLTLYPYLQPEPFFLSTINLRT